MVDYTLTVTVDPKWVKYFNDNQYLFCFARDGSDGGSQAAPNVSPLSKSLWTTEFGDNINIDTKVIAIAEDVSNNVTVKWTDDYAIAASETGFVAGSKCTTPKIPIFIL